MSWVFPMREAIETTRLGVASAFFWLASALLFGAVLDATAAVALTNPPAAWVAFVAIGLVWLCVLAVRARSRMHPLLLVALALVAGAASGALAWGLYPAGVLEAGASPFPVVAVGVSIVITGGVADRWTGAIGNLLGYLAFQLGLLAGFAVAGVTPAFDVTVLAVAIVVAMFNLLLGSVRARARSATARLDSAGVATLAAAERAALEMHSRALLHDTVLGELAALGISRPGPLPERALTSISESLSLLDTAYPGTPVGESAPPPHQLAELLARMLESGLRVGVEGDTAALERVPGASRTALLLAIEQCLINVVRHAGVDHAEISFTASDHQLTVTIVDSGSGFDESAVGADRFGLRESVKGRIAELGGSSRILSSPGNGTVVVLSLPVEGSP